MNLSNRQKKSNELWDLQIGLKHENLSAKDKQKLIDMLSESAENMEDIGYDWKIQQSTREEIIEGLTNAFGNLQETLESIEEDPFKNDWTCNTCNRRNARSMGLMHFVKDITKIQKTLYQKLNLLVTSAKKHLEEELEMTDSDYRFNTEETRSYERR